jgi:hypothetical protein
MKNKASSQPKTNKNCAWLQIHLSTAIMLMFVSGIFLWANLSSRFPRIWQGLFFNTNNGAELPQYGWPFAIYPTYVYHKGNGYDSEIPDGVLSIPQPSWIFLAANIFFLILLYYACPRFLVRKHGQK